MESHRLVIKSFRDINVECSCGLWSMMGVASDSDTDETVRENIDAQFRRHAAAAGRRAERDKSRVY